MASLTTLMQKQLPAGGVMLAERTPHMEIVDKHTGMVWMSIEGVSQQQFESFNADEQWRKVGRAVGVMDQALFRHSPGAAEEPMRHQLINDIVFIDVAMPETPIVKEANGGLIELIVHKNHVLGFEAGRSISILHLHGRDYVEVVGDTKNDADIALPDGANIQKITLEAPWVVELPVPTQTLWVFEPDWRSFQGPVDLPN